MRAIRVHIAGDDRRLEMEEVPKPTPTADQVLVRASAIGVNRADLGRGRGASGGRQEPYTPGLDVGGVIEEIGSDVTGWSAGDPVIALVRGAYAEFSIAPAVMAYQPPAGMAMHEAASIPCVFLTAWYGLTNIGKMQPGETVLVHAAGSGVGTAAIQIAKDVGGPRVDVGGKRRQSSQGH